MDKDRDVLFFIIIYAITNIPLINIENIIGGYKMLKDPKPNKEEFDFLEEIQAEQPDCKMDSCVLDSGNYEEPQPLLEEKQWRDRLNAKWY